MIFLFNRKGIPSDARLEGYVKDKSDLFVTLQPTLPTSPSTSTVQSTSHTAPNGRYTTSFFDFTTWISLHLPCGINSNLLVHMSYHTELWYTLKIILIQFESKFMPCSMIII